MVLTETSRGRTETSGGLGLGGERDGDCLYKHGTSFPVTMNKVLELDSRDGCTALTTPDSPEVSPSSRCTELGVCELHPSKAVK